LSFLIEKAFGLSPAQIMGGPAWLRSEGYQVEAKADSAASNEQILMMLRSLLEDRFQLKTHVQTKEAPVYLLVAAKGGLKLPPPKESNCWPEDALPAPGRGRPASLFKCGRLIRGGGVDSPSEILKGGGVAMPELVRALSTAVGRPVIDKTGFTGTFDVEMTFAAEDATAADPALPSLFLALQEQLGLRLESSKARVDLLVIDRVERPSSN
jgi:uncharacterized protein (TIGR03435 family)